MDVKTADSKGRITLGTRFANQTVIVEEVDATEVRVVLAQAVPQRELWLHKNPDAKTLVLQGLVQARAGKMAKSAPNLKQDSLLAEQLRDD